jgi:hypothetical protein
MEALWHVTAEHAPAGDVGRLSDDDLCDELYWDQDPGELVEAFVRAGVLERHPDHRLVVHGWSEHADNALRHKLRRAGATFWDGETPFNRARTAAQQDESPTEHGQTATDHEESPPVGDAPRSDEIEPASNQCQQPVPATSDQRPTELPPLAPPAPRVGTGVSEVHQVGDVLRDGRVVREVDGNGIPLVVSRGEAPIFTREANQAVNRLVAYASGKLGYRFDRVARRRLRDRLVAGETESQVRAGYEAQVAALEAAEAFEAPPGDGDDDTDLDQALRLAERPVADVPAFLAAKGPAS